MSAPLQSRQLDQIFDDLAHSAAAAPDPATFAENLVDAALAATGSEGAAVWTFDPPAIELLLSKRLSLGHEHRQLAMSAVQSGHTKTASDPQHNVLIAAPLREGGEPRAVLLLSLSADTLHDHAEETIAALSELAEDYFRNRTAERMRRDNDQLKQLTQFTLLLHRSPARAIPHTVAHELPQLVGCDRALVLAKGSRKVTAVAATGADTLDARSEVVRAARQLAQLSIVTNETVWSRESLAPQVSAAIEQYCDAAHTRALGVLPLHDRNHEPVGAVLLDWLHHEPSAEEQARAAEVVQHAAGPLCDSFSSVWRTLLQWATHRMTAIIVVALLLAAWLLTAPVPFYIYAPGVVQPSHRRHVFAPADGLVTRMRVAHGDDVQAGQPLFDLESLSLQRELTSLEGKAQTLSAQLKVLDSELLSSSNATIEASNASEQLAAQERLVREQRAGVQMEIAMLKRQLEELSVLSPLTGRVVSWDVQRDWGRRPLRRGQTVLRIDDHDGPWEVELKLPESGYGRLQERLKGESAALPVEYRLTSSPESSCVAILHTMGVRAEIGAKGQSFVRGLASTDTQQWSVQPRSGASVQARILCGNRSRAFVWFHEVIDFVRRRLFL